MASPAERLTGIIGAMLAELRGGAAPAVTLDAELERDLGIDSLARVELTLRIERAFGVRLQEESVVAARSAFSTGILFTPWRPLFRSSLASASIPRVRIE